MERKLHHIVEGALHQNLLVNLIWTHCHLYWALLLLNNYITNVSAFICAQTQSLHVVRIVASQDTQNRWWCTTSSKWFGARMRRFVLGIFAFWRQKLICFDVRGYEESCQNHFGTSELWLKHSQVGTTSMYDLFRSVLGTGEHLRCIKEACTSILLYLFSLAFSELFMNSRWNGMRAKRVDKLVMFCSFSSHSSFGTVIYSLDFSAVSFTITTPSPMAIFHGPF